MEKVLKNKFFIVVVIFYLLFIYVGALMTRNMNHSNTKITTIEKI